PRRGGLRAARPADRFDGREDGHRPLQPARERAAQAALDADAERERHVRLDGLPAVAAGTKARPRDGLQHGLLDAVADLGDALLAVAPVEEEPLHDLGLLHAPALVDQHPEADPRADVPALGLAGVVRQHRADHARTDVGALDEAGAFVYA